jgi:biopolymer transport protein ExbB/TolQ
MPDLSTWTETLQSGGAVLVVMLFASVILVAIALARFWVMISARIALSRLNSRVMSAVRSGNWEEARKKCDGISSPLREVFIAGLDRTLGKVKGDPAMAMHRESKRAMGQIRSTLWILGSTGALMPFVGLFGTVVGVMSAFKAIGEAATGGIQVVSGGIAEALVSTAAGIFVALEAVIFFNILQSLSTGIARDLSLLVDEFLEQVAVRRSDAERAG